MTSNQTKPRANFYTLIHKAIRFKLYDYSIELGKVDLNTEEDVQRLQEQFLTIKDLLEHHSYHEDTYLHPFMKKYLPEEVALIEGDHEHLDADLEALNNWATRLRDEKDSKEKQTIWNEFYLQYNDFVASFVKHLHLEEYVAMPKLWPLCTDEELMEIHHQDLMQLGIWNQQAFQQ